MTPQSIMQVKPSSELTPEDRAEIAKYLPDGIDVNTMADIFYSVFQNFTTIKEKYEKVEPWGIDSQLLKDFIQNLSNFEIEIIKVNQNQLIPLDRVLSKPGNRWKLALALSHLETRHKAPPILVNAYQVEGIGCWYIVTNGMHRATAAKIMGLEEIEAEVIREIVLDCAAIRREYCRYPRESYLLEVLGIKRSFPGFVELIWKTLKSIQSELDD